MRRTELAGLILASALVTLDGTATTIALPAIGRDLAISVSRLQWISNAPLLVLTAMLLPAGSLADHYGRMRVMRAGLACFAAASLLCALVPSDLWLVAAKFAQGLGAALILPTVLAILRNTFDDPAERARIFGVWAAWTGVASAAGPLLAGGLVDLLSWRAVFVPSTAAAIVALLILRSPPTHEPALQRRRIPVLGTVALVVILAGVSHLLIDSASLVPGSWRFLWPATLAVLAAAVFARDPHREALLPRELLAARNCVPANAATFALYFGMFGLSFLVVLYSQQVLGYSALWAAVVLLPMSLMLLLAERFGRLIDRFGTRALVLAGAVAEAGGIAWIAAGPDPLPFWSHLIAGTALFGLGLSVAVSALTHAAVAAVPETCAGAASGLNHATVRAAGLVAIAVLGSIAAPGFAQTVSDEGVRRALLICAGIVVCGGLAAGVFLRNEEPGGLGQEA